MAEGSAIDVNVKITIEFLINKFRLDDVFLRIKAMILTNQHMQQSTFRWLFSEDCYYHKNCATVPESAK